MNSDVIIIGGSFAGQSAALQLARARRKVLLIDAGQPRNRFAKAAHGFLGQDGQTPSDILANAGRQLGAYPTVRRHEERAIDVAVVDDSVRVRLVDGHEAVGKYLILATGVRDVLPELPGLRDRWGVSVLHCPYCHGYELNKRPVGVLARNELAIHQAMLVSDWGLTTLFTQGVLVPTSDHMTMLATRGVTVEQTPVVELLGTSPQLEAVRLADCRTVPLSGLFVAPQTSLSSDLPEKLGCAFENGPMGPYVSVDAQQRTSVPHVFAAGDIASPMANIAFAVAAGAMAAVSVHQTLIFGDK